MASKAEMTHARCDLCSYPSASCFIIPYDNEDAFNICEDCMGFIDKAREGEG